jgi:hypothetical protein
MNEQVGMNGEEGEGKSDNKKRVFLNEPLAYWYSPCKTGICNVTQTANLSTKKMYETCQMEFNCINIHP